MSVEEKKYGIVQLAKDSSGISAFKWIHDRSNIIPRILKLPYAMFFVPWEFGLPATFRALTELQFSSRSNNKEKEDLAKIGCATMLRDVTTMIVAGGTGFVAWRMGLAPDAAFTSMLFTKFILNGVVHYEFSKFKK